jgi:hypothetical protein
MDWLRLHWRQHKAAIFAAALVAAVLAVYVLFPINMQNKAPGFGPDWECTPQPKGEPICMKKIR